MTATGSMLLADTYCTLPFIGGARSGRETLARCRDPIYRQIGTLLIVDADHAYA